jgi:hypothetical protein
VDVQAAALTGDAQFVGGAKSLAASLASQPKKQLRPHGAVHTNGCRSDAVMRVHMRSLRCCVLAL